MAAVAGMEVPLGRAGRTVPEQLRAIMGQLRSEGLSFDRAWREGLTRVVWPESQRETTEWERAMAATKQAWRATYEGWEPLPEEAAVAGLGEHRNNLST